MSLTPELIAAGYTEEPSMIHGPYCQNAKLTCCECGKNLHCLTCGYGRGCHPCDCSPDTEPVYRFDP